MGNFLASLLSKLSGPFSWIIGLFIDKLLAKAKVWYEEWAAERRRKAEVEKERIKDQAANTAYKETLKDGAKDEDQVSSTTDLLNR